MVNRCTLLTSIPPGVFLWGAFPDDAAATAAWRPRRDISCDRRHATRLVACVLDGRGELTRILTVEGEYGSAAAGVYLDLLCPSGFKSPYDSATAVLSRHPMDAYPHPHPLAHTQSGPMRVQLARCLAVGVARSVAKRSSVVIRASAI